MGIGLGLNINPGLTAGMIVSGAIFGDKNVSVFGYYKFISRRSGNGYF